MTAIFRALLPYSIYIPSDWQPNKSIRIESKLDDLTADFLSPFRARMTHEDFALESNSGIMGSAPDLALDIDAKDSASMKINGCAAIPANCIQVNFRKVDFDRTINNNLPLVYDPPIDFAFECANYLLDSIRALTKAPTVKPISSLSTFWLYLYRNDDFSELPEEDGKVRERCSTWMRYTISVLNPVLWSDLEKNLAECTLKPWEKLLLDAQDLLPEIGPAIVLAHTAIENLAALATNHHSQQKIPSDLWLWLTNRSPHYLEPSTADALDVIHKAFTCESLKDDPGLWEKFQHLRKARNTFVHEGLAKIGNEEVDLKKAIELINGSGEIASWIEGRLPEKMKRFRSQSLPKIEISKRIFSEENEG